MRIVHIFRAPVGGLFRHVKDLARAQAEAGHEVGLVCDSLTGWETSEEDLAALKPLLALGLLRMPMPRPPSPADFRDLMRIRRHLADLKPDIVHGHGSKGGLHARLGAGAGGARSVYTPHGGSLHYAQTTPAGALYMVTERLLLRRTGGLVFVCDYERRAYEERMGRIRCPWTIVHNGLSAAEFGHVPPAPEAAEFLFIGELRPIKGVDVLLKALKRLQAEGRAARLVVVGDGPDREMLEGLARELGLSGHVRFTGALHAPEAWPLGRIVVVPSRAESFPYVVLEAQAAGRPVIATAVGGIPEMLPETALVPREDEAALAARMAQALENLEAETEAAIARIEKLKTRFSVETMTRGILAFYERILGGR